MMKNRKYKILLLVLLSFFIIFLPNFSNAAKVSVGKVKSLKVSSQSTNSIKISWKKVSKAKGYRVYVCTGSSKSYKYYGKTTSKSMTIKKLSSAKEYKIKVRAYRTVKKKNYYGAYSTVLETATKPSQVKKLKVKSQTNNTIKLSWSKVTRATGYKVYVYNTSKKKYEYKDTTKTNSITIKKLSDAKEYKIKVRAYKKYDGKKYYGSYSSVVTTVTKPDQVKSLKASSQNDNSIEFSWKKISGASGYRIYMYNSSKKKFEYKGETKTNSITIKSLTSAKEYKVKVRAFKEYKKTKYYGSYSSDYSTVTKPSQLKDLKVDSQNDVSITLSWSKVSRATGYRVYVYNDSTGSYNYKGETKNNSITVTELTPAKEYKIKVRAYKEYDKTKYYGSYSSVLTTVTKPSRISNFIVTDSNVSSVTLSWDAIPGITKYKVYVCNSKTNTYETYQKTTSNSITISDLDSKITYKFKVRAYKTFEDVNYYGSYSNEIEKKTRKGLDVSKWQEKIDWKKVKDDGIEFVMIRIGYRGYAERGTLVEDEYFEQNIKGALQNGIEVGVYFYAYAKDEEEAEEEAQWVIDTLAKYDISIDQCKYIAHDFEEFDQRRVEGISKTQISKNAITFLNYVKKAGYIPMLYANKNYLENIYKTEDILSAVSGCKVWLAHYTKATNYKGMYNMWQYTSEGSVKGVSGNADLSEVYF